jgi:arylsulfatase A-like enzyme
MKPKSFNILILGITLFVLCVVIFACEGEPSRPNVIFIFGDEWRAQATGFMGNNDVKTPNLDKLASKGVVFTHAVSGCPVCSPYRASLLTGQYPLTHGVFYNDKPLNTSEKTIAELFKAAGYTTAYIGKWHVNGHPKSGSTREGRRSPIPKNRRRGFEYWKVCECTHNYNNSIYFDEQNQAHTWNGYDAIAQTQDAMNYIQHTAASEKPFLLFLSWGPPHDPYYTAPKKYEDMYQNCQNLSVRPNVPEKFLGIAHKKLRGYYAHISALDDCVGNILKTIRDTGIESRTILIFTSDHGEMLYSHGYTKKQKPWDESIRVPFILRYPRVTGTGGFLINTPINTPDIMPTLLGLAGLNIPESVEGVDLSELIKNREEMKEKVALLQFPVPFHQWNYRIGGKEYRGIRTIRYTYVKDLQGPWLLYDNLVDPYQRDNLVNKVEYSAIQKELEKTLETELVKRNDQFLPGPEYMKKWDYNWDPDDSPDAKPLKH